jgi:hypothetical protein
MGHQVAPEVPRVLIARADNSAERLLATQGAFRSFKLVDDRHKHVTVFATGSLGRHEMGTYSDLDVFIIDCARGIDYDEPRLGHLETVLLVADLVRAGHAAGFPPFSRDGEFLQVHRLDHLERYLGKPDEDKLNVFTARMLLLLESQCLVGQSAYEHCVDFVLGRYWAEDKAHTNFKPTFLANDIVRYWKTLCVSYEGWREDPGLTLSASARIDLLKLKFNRAWLCFNGLAYLLLGDPSGKFPRSHGRQLVRLTPVQRMTEIAARAPGEKARVQEALDLYARWLELAGHEGSLVRDRLGEDDTYAAVSSEASRFGDVMWELVTSLGTRAGLSRYLLV